MNGSSLHWCALVLTYRPYRTQGAVRHSKYRNAKSAMLDFCVPCKHGPQYVQKKILSFECLSEKIWIFVLATELLGFLTYSVFFFIAPKADHDQLLSQSLCFCRFSHQGRSGWIYFVNRSWEFYFFLHHPVPKNLMPTL